MVTEKDIEKLADLARIAVSESEKKDLKKDIEGILDYVSQIKKAKTEESSGWEPAERNVMRKDEVKNQTGEYTKTLVKAAPKSDGNWVKVKKIL